MIRSLQSMGAYSFSLVETIGEHLVPERVDSF